MKNLRFLTVILSLVVLASAAVGCDNRSQIEKDADKAVTDVKKALK